MKSLNLLFLLFLFSTSIFAQNFELKPYGFIKAEAVYASKGVLSFGNTDLSASQLASGKDTSMLGFTAQHSRFGLKGSIGDDFKVDGVIELDFFWGGFETNARSRIRQAYASISKGNFEARFGQQWDLFSPSHPITNNTNGYLWFGGNLGFRRTQFQLNYKFPVENLSPLLQLSFGEAAKEGAGVGPDNYALMPMIQGRLSFKLLNKHTIGAYFAYAKFSPNPDTSGYDFDAFGFGVDFNFPMHKLFSLFGEASIGTNLNNCNLFTIAGNGSKANDKKSLSFWANALSKVSDDFHIAVGLGMDKNQTDNLAKGTTEQNMVVYGNLIFPFDHGFSLTLEIENFSTKIKDVDTFTALVVNLAAKLNF